MIQYVNSTPPPTNSQQVNAPQNEQQTPPQNQNYQNTRTRTDNLSSTASYTVKTDGRQYEVINGSDGNVVTAFGSNSANYTLNTAIARGGIVAIQTGNYAGRAA